VGDRTHLKLLAAIWIIGGGGAWYYTDIQSPPDLLVLLMLGFAGAAYIASFFARREV
jgi:hypothetical protein